MTSLAWSPDGSRIAYQRISTPGTVVGDGILGGSEKWEIWTIGADGTGRTLQTKPFDVNHGIGPVWSPSGDRIVYQRICGTNPISGGACREEHDVVLLTPGTTLSASRPVGSEVVLPVVRVGGALGPANWFPFQVSWSPDGQKLLELAWSGYFPKGPPYASGIGLLVVDVAESSPPILLHEAGSISLGEEWPATMQVRSWGRLLGGSTAK